MSMYRFCGAFTEIGIEAIKLEKFGQQIELPDEMAQQVILGGGAIVPSDHPVWKSFTEQELSIYANPMSHGQANAAFLAKKRKAQLAFHEIHTRLKAGGALNDPAPAVTTDAAPATEK